MLGFAPLSSVPISALPLGAIASVVLACVQCYDTQGCVGTSPPLCCSSAGQINSYLVGNLVRLVAVFTDISNDPINPTDVTLYVRAPDGTVEEISFPGTLTEEATGTFYYNLALDETGYYYYRFEGSGNVMCAAEGQLKSNNSAFGTL